MSVGKFSLKKSSRPCVNVMCGFSNTTQVLALKISGVISDVAADVCVPVCVSVTFVCISSTNNHWKS